MIFEKERDRKGGDVFGLCVERWKVLLPRDSRGVFDDPPLGGATSFFMGRNAALNPELGVQKHATKSSGAESILFAGRGVLVVFAGDGFVFPVHVAMNEFVDPVCKCTGRTILTGFRVHVIGAQLSLPHRIQTRPRFDPVRPNHPRFGLKPHRHRCRAQIASLDRLQIAAVNFNRKGQSIAVATAWAALAQIASLSLDHLAEIAGQKLVRDLDLFDLGVDGGRVESRILVGHQLSGMEEAMEKEGGALTGWSQLVEGVTSVWLGM